MKLQSNTCIWKCKYITAAPITICLQFLKQTLYCIIPLFHECVVLDWNYVPVLLCSVWLCHLIYQINNSVGYLYLVSDKSWKVCQEQINGVNAVSLNSRVYESELVTLKILYFNYIHFMQNVSHLCPNI